ncbi:MAG TPA: prolyl aminopeptidase [Polyangiaceae bacterium]|nr:prolyl aminopeptidase [Polyangiaceae bacterium]
MVDLYPAIEPHDHGMLAVGDENFVAWEVSGAANGKPVVVLHGGPGQGSAPGMRRAFDPARYRIVLYDQRGCGRSFPHAGDPATNMAFNTTEHLIADIEALRLHLGIDRWLVAGGSWGCTLALAYAERHPDHVTQIVLTSVTTSRRVEADWLYRGAARFFPAARELFRNHVPEAVRDEDVIRSYASRMEHADAEVRLAAAHAWCAWEDAVLSLEVNARGSSYAHLAAPDLLAFVRICTHYLRHAAWLEEGALIRNAHRLANIPGVLIHGQRDMSCPLETAWELARAWPGAELVTLSDAGHLRTESKRLALLRALDKFARE